MAVMSVDHSSQVVYQPAEESVAQQLIQLCEKGELHEVAQALQGNLQEVSLKEWGTLFRKLAAHAGSVDLLKEISLKRELVDDDFKEAFKAAIYLGDLQNISFFIPHLQRLEECIYSGFKHLYENKKFDCLELILASSDFKPHPPPSYITFLLKVVDKEPFEDLLRFSKNEAFKGLIATRLAFLFVSAIRAKRDAEYLTKFLNWEIFFPEEQLQIADEEEAIWAWEKGEELQDRTAGLKLLKMAGQRLLCFDHLFDFQIYKKEDVAEWFSAVQEAIKKGGSGNVCTLMMKTTFLIDIGLENRREIAKLCSQNQSVENVANVSIAKTSCFHLFDCKVYKMEEVIEWFSTVEEAIRKGGSKNICTFMKETTFLIDIGLKRREALFELCYQNYSVANMSIAEVICSPPFALEWFSSEFVAIAILESAKMGFADIFKMLSTLASFRSVDSTLLADAFARATKRGFGDILYSMIHCSRFEDFQTDKLLENVFQPLIALKGGDKFESNYEKAASLAPACIEIAKKTQFKGLFKKSGIDNVFIAAAGLGLFEVVSSIHIHRRGELSDSTLLLAAAQTCSNHFFFKVEEIAATRTSTRSFKLVPLELFDPIEKEELFQFILNDWAMFGNFKGEDFEEKRYPNFRHLFMYAARFGSLEQIHILLDRFQEDKMSFKPKDLETARAAAAQNGHDEVAKLLQAKLLG